MDIQNLLKEIDIKKDEIDRLRPIKSEFLHKIQQKMNIAYNYHSNHLEWNSLTYQETRSFIQTGLIQSSKENQKYRDYKEIEWHDKAVKSIWLTEKLQYTEKSFTQNEELKITQNLIRELHQMILVEDHKIQKRDENWEEYWMEIKVGEYKSKDNFIKKTSDWEAFKYVEHQKVGEKMYDLLNWFDENKDKHHPLIICSMFHYKFIRIHPFDDGNGRMSRLLMNMILMYYGYPLIIVPSDEKWKRWYYDSLEITDTLLPNIEDTINSNDEILFENFTNYLWNRLLESMDWVIRGASWEEILDSDDMLKKFRLEMKAKSEWNANKYNTERIENNENQKIFFENILNPLINGINKFWESIFDLYTSGNVWLVYSENNQNKWLNEIISNENSILQIYNQKYKNIFNEMKIIPSHKSKIIYNYRIELKGLKNVKVNRDDVIHLNCSFEKDWIVFIIQLAGQKIDFQQKYWDITPIKEEKEIVEHLIQIYKKKTENLYI